MVGFGRDVTKTRNGERAISKGNGKMKVGKKQRIENEVTVRARVYSQFLFSRSPSSFSRSPVSVTQFSHIKHPIRSERVPNFHHPLLTANRLAPVVRKVDNAIRRMKIYPVDNATGLLACVASVSNRFIARTLEREQTKRCFFLLSSQLSRPARTEKLATQARWISLSNV